MWNCILSSVLREGYTGKKYWFGFGFLLRKEDLNFFDVEKKKIGKILYRAPFFFLK